MHFTQFIVIDQGTRLSEQQVVLYPDIEESVGPVADDADLRSFHRLDHPQGIDPILIYGILDDDRVVIEPALIEV